MGSRGERCFANIRGAKLSETRFSPFRVLCRFRSRVAIGSSELAMAPTPLGTAASAALLAEFSKRHGRHVLPKDLVVQKIVDFFVARGESLTELPLEVDLDDEPSWEAEWLQVAEDASISLLSDRLKLVGACLRG